MAIDVSKLEVRLSENGKTFVCQPEKPIRFAKGWFGGAIAPTEAALRRNVERLLNDTPHLEEAHA
jgi:hypothetical protein